MELFRASGPAISAAVEKNAEVKAFMENSYTCQSTCMGKSFPVAFQTLAQAGTFNIQDKSERNTKVKAALTGTIDSCYPGLSHALATTVIDDAEKILEADEEKVERLFARVQDVEEKSSIATPGAALSGIALAAIGLFLGAVVLRMRKRRQAASEISLEDGAE